MLIAHCIDYHVLSKAVYEISFFYLYTKQVFLTCGVIKMKKWESWVAYFKPLAFLFDTNDQGTNINLDGAYCMITVQ